MSHPVTQEFFKQIRNSRENTIRLLAFGTELDDRRQNQLVGTVTALTHVLDVDFEE